MKRFTKARILLAAYLTLGIASWIGAGVGLAGLLSGGGNTGQSQNSSGLNAFGMGNLSAGMNNELGFYTQALPYWQSTAANLENLSPAGAINAGNQAGQLYGNASNLAQQYSGLLGQQYPALMSAGNSLYNTALDPQGALYNQLLQQTQSQANATNSMYGLGSSAAGAGLTNNATNNFNLDWQNQQLGRQATGLQGLEGAYSQGANVLGASQSMYNQAPGLQLQSGTVPFETAASAYQLPGQAASTLYNNQYGADVQPYLSAAGMGGNYNTGQQQNPYGQQAASGQALFSGLNGISNGNNTAGNYLASLFGGGSSGSGSGLQGASMGPELNASIYSNPGSSSLFGTNNYAQGLTSMFSGFGGGT